MVVDMWPRSSSTCLSSCSQSRLVFDYSLSQSRLVWDHSFSQISPSSFQSASFSAEDRVSQTAAARIVDLRCVAADAVTRRSLAGDSDQISALGRALDRLSSLSDRLRSDLGRVAAENHRTMNTNINKNRCNNCVTITPTRVDVGRVARSV